MTIADLLSDLRYVASRRRVRAHDLDDNGRALVELGWAEYPATEHSWYLVVTLDGLDVLYACRDVVLEAA